MKNASVIRILCGDDESTVSNRKDTSMLTKATYNRKQATLTVEIDNRTSHYYNVPLYVYNQLTQASSIDQHFNNYIRNKYPSESVN